MGMIPIGGTANDFNHQMAARQPLNRLGTWLGGLGKATTLETRPGPGLAGDATDATLQAARSNEILRERMMRGRAATFLTGPQGLTSPPPTGKTLLGG